MVRDRRLDLADPEGLARHLAQRPRVDEELVPQHRLELAGVHLGNEDMLVTLQQGTQVRRHRPDVADMDVVDVGAALAGAPHRLVDRAVGRSPADHRQLAARPAQLDLLVRHRDPRHLVAAKLGQVRVGGGRLGDVAGPLRLLDAADAVEQAGRARLHPRPGELVVARIGQEPAFGHVLQEGDRKRLEGAEIRHFPRLGRVLDIAVGQQHDRRHVRRRDTHRLDRARETVRGAARRDHRHRRVAVAAVDRLVQVRLLGLGRQSGGRPAALGVDDHQRELGHDREADRLALQRDARPRRAGDAELAGVGRADRRGDRGDLVLRLEGGNAIFLQPREAVQDRRGRGDRVAAEEHRHVRQAGAGDQAQADRVSAGDGAVQPRLGRRGGDVVLLQRPRQFRRLAIGMAGVERGDVRLGQRRRLGEFGLEPVDDRLAVAVEHPERQPQRPHVLAAQRLLVAEAEGLHRVEGELRDVERQQLPFREAAVGQRVGGVFRLVEVALAELALVGDDEAAGLERVDVHLEAGRVHRHQHVGLVAGRLDLGGAEVDLERRHAEQRALRRADLRGEVGEGRQVVAGERGGQGELAAGQLHAVAAVAGETDDDRFGVRERRRLGGGDIVDSGGHDAPSRSANEAGASGYAWTAASHAWLKAASRRPPRSPRAWSSAHICAPPAPRGPPGTW